MHTALTGFICGAGTTECMKAVFDMLLLNTGLHAATTLKFCHQVVHSNCH